MSVAHLMQRTFSAANRVLYRLSGGKARLGCIIIGSGGEAAGKQFLLAAEGVARQSDVGHALLRVGLLGVEGALELGHAELGVADQVRLLGHRSDGPDLLRAADFFLLPSTQEGLPLSILEAQACKVPARSSMATA